MFRNAALLLVALYVISGCSTLDRRSINTSLEDTHIESQAINLINSNYNGVVHINVTSFNRHVLLTGEVPDDSSKAEIAKIVAKVPDVSSINNELFVGKNEGIASRSADSLLTSSIKMRFVGSGSFRSGHVKVVTENSSVYLMGLVTHKEAQIAADLASTTSGVKQVITLFEYID